MSIMARGRRDISDSVWEKPDPRLPGREGSRGGGARDNRRFVNVVGLCAGAPWRDPPPAPGGWSDTRRRFIRWRDNGVRERPPEIPIDDPDPAWLMNDAGHCRVHPHAAGARGGNRDMIRAKGGSTQNRIWLRMRMVCRSGLLPHGARQRIALGQSLRLTDLRRKDFWRTGAATRTRLSPGLKNRVWKRSFLRGKTAGSGMIATGSLAGPDARWITHFLI